MTRRPAGQRSPQAIPGGPGGPGRVPPPGGGVLRGHGRPRLLAADDREPAGHARVPRRLAGRAGRHPPRRGDPAGAGVLPAAPVPLPQEERATRCRSGRSPSGCSPSGRSSSGPPGSGTCCTTPPARSSCRGPSGGSPGPRSRQAEAELVLAQPDICRSARGPGPGDPGGLLLHRHPPLRAGEPGGHRHRRRPAARCWSARARASRTA